jgi:hypothetical protein
MNEIRVDADSALPSNGQTVLRQAVAAARAEMSPEYVAVLRSLPPGVRTAQAFSLWRSARDALFRQGIRRGLTEAEANVDAARRMLASGDDPST